MPKPAGCLIEPDRVAELGSPVVGIVERVHVERGDRVAAGQPVASLRSAVESANVNVAEMRAKMDADVRASKASLDLAKQKVQRAESLVAQNFISTQALEQATAEHELAVQKLNQARGQQQLWDGERRVAAAQLGLRVVRSPFAGVVVERYVNAGERVEEKPLFRVAVIDPLRVELMVSTQQFGSVKIGDSLTVRPELPGVQPVVARVVHIDRVMDAASNTFRVRLSLPNPNDQLPAGLRCKADLPAVAGSAAAASRPASGVGVGVPAASARPAGLAKAPLIAAAVQPNVAAPAWSSAAGPAPVADPTAQPATHRSAKAAVKPEPLNGKPRDANAPPPGARVAATMPRTPAPARVEPKAPTGDDNTFAAALAARHRLELQGGPNAAATAAGPRASSHSPGADRAAVPNGRPEPTEPVAVPRLTAPPPDAAQRIASP